MESIFLPLLLSFTLFSGSLTQSDSNSEMYIIIDSTRVFPCRNVKTLIDIEDRDVVIRDDRGNKAYYIKAPGNYSIHFQKIQVQESLPNLSGEISATLQVPLFEGPAGLRFDVPYQIIPQAGLFNQFCDAQSGVVSRNGQTYCRYCDLCMTTSDIEKHLNADRKLVPGLAPSGPQDDFSRICTQVETRSYDIMRAIRIPDRQELERQYKQQVGDGDSDLRKRLDKGVGRLQVQLNLLSSTESPLSKEDFYARAPGCRCCSQKSQNELTCQLLRAFNCNEGDCRTKYVNQCLQGDTRVAACFTAEFTYKVTSNFEDVQKFLREHNLPVGSTSTGSQSPSPVLARTNQSGPAAGIPKRDRCLANMQAPPNLKRYCTMFWNEKACCTRCEGFC